MGKKEIVAEEPVVDEVGVKHVTFHLISREAHALYVSVMVSICPASGPLVHDLMAHPAAESHDAVTLTQGVKRILGNMGYEDVMVNSNDDPLIKDSWFRRAGAEHVVSFYRMSTGVKKDGNGNTLHRSGDGTVQLVPEREAGRPAGEPSASGTISE